MANTAEQRSFWYRLNGNDYVKTELPCNSQDRQNKWEWTKIAVLPIHRGVNTIDFVPMQSDVMLDKIILSFGVRNVSNMILGYKTPQTDAYTTQMVRNIEYNDDWVKESFAVPSAATVTFEVITNLLVGNSGVNNSLYIE